MEVFILEDPHGVRAKGTARQPEDFFSFPAVKGESLLSVLQRAGAPVQAPCGGNGTCGKCAVEVKRPDGEWERVLACQTDAEDGMMVVPVPHKDGLRVEGSDSDAAALARFSLDAAPAGQLGIAVDLGTTTIAAYLFDAATGKLLARGGVANPQASFGADVISRIQASAAGALDVLEDAAVRCIRQLARDLCVQAGADPSRIARWTVAGNTVMEHILCGISPESIGSYPFEPQTLFGDCRAVAGMGDTYLCPCVSGYVGGDISAGIVACGLDAFVDLGDGAPSAVPHRRILFADLGTNGEMALIADGKLICCATATGPAFEGANISQGMQARSGAIDSCRFEGDSFRITVVGDVEPVGVCGSGLIDALAACLEAGVVDETGRMLAPDQVPENRAHLVALRGGKPVARLTPTGTVALTQKDVRALQLAKAAVSAGIVCMLAEAGIEPSQIDEFVVGGAFGAHLRPAAAAAIGMFPEELAPKVRLVGNCAGAGACAALLSEDARVRMKAVSEAARYVELSLDERFSDAYIDAMEFEGAIV